MPLTNDCRWVDAHDLIALHTRRPSFIIESESILGSRIKTGVFSPGEINRKPSVALTVSAIHKSPSRIRKRCTLVLDDVSVFMPSSAVSPPSHTTMRLFISSSVINLTLLSEATLQTFTSLRN